MNDIEFSDVQASLHCPMAAASGYDPQPTLGNEKLSRRILTEWPSNTDPLMKIVHSLAKSARWLSRTRFSMAGGQCQPPSSEGDGYWIDETTGRLPIEISDDTVFAVCHLPYLHRLNGVWEVVYCHTRADPMDMRRRSDLIARASWDQALFRHITGEKLFARLLAPSYRHEEELKLRETSIRGMVLHVLSTSVAPIPTPGLHCNDTKPEVDSQQGYQWQCPVRESGDCSAVRSWTTGKHK